ncbi:MAG: polyphosphate kinase 2 family protein [Thaumarchaeota archaeon]|nr:polyphosphate kinase 2 family protein [Nitrososphaerota archaeon]
MNQNIEKFIIKPGSKVNLKKFDTSYNGKLQKEEAKSELEIIHQKMSDMQYKIHAEKKQALLIVLQAMDAGGKDGTIRDVMYGFNPQGCKVKSFRAPNDVEINHDYLWRVHMVIPARGEIGILNRSHYGDVLVVRVHNLVPPKQWSKRYEHINNFEKMLTDEGVRVLKLFLHISKEEQRKRLYKRLENPLKHWKVDEADFEERKFWNDYVKAHEQMLEKCSKPWSPWYVIPGDKKWYRNLLVGQIITKTLEDMNPKMPKSTINVAKFKGQYQ